jgi:hypothetical protein
MPYLKISAIAAVCATLAMPGLIQAHPIQASGALPQAVAQTGTLEVGRTQEIKFDDKALFQLKPGEKVKLRLDGVGALPLVFEHATPQYNNTTFWEAHVEGDRKQRVSLKRSAQGLSGSVMLQSKRYWISQLAGKTFLTRMSDAYEPTQKNVAETKVFGAAIQGAALTRLHAERPSDLPATG